MVGAVLAVAACGKSSEDEDKLSRTALPPKANPICDKAERELVKVRQPIGFTNPAQAENYFRALQRITSKAAHDLEELEPDDE